LPNLFITYQRRADAGSVTQRQDPETVVLDLVQPVGAGRRGFGRGW
jgi:hypothetical protein